MAKKLLIGCGSLIVLVLILAGIGGALNSGARPASSPAASESAGASTSAAAVASKQTLLDVQGTGTKTTNKFTANGDWDINWNYDCANFGQNGAFQIYIFGKDSQDLKGVGANELGAKGADVSHQHDTGTFFLEINSVCTWHVTVTG